MRKLVQILEEAENQSKSRYQKALSAYRSAMNSPEAATELYLKCVELIQFDEMKKKEGDFRKWKRENDERLSQKGLGKALQFQLLWLVLSLEAAEEKADKNDLARHASEYLRLLTTDAKELSKHQGILRQNVLSSLFANAYEINGTKISDWPLAPLPIEMVYEKVILPNFRSSTKIDELKAAWNDRMKNEAVLLDQWSQSMDDSGQSAERSPEYDQFLVDTLPRLKWKAQLDYFQYGNQRQTAAEMFSHIENHLSHPSAKEWTEQLVELLTPPSEKSN